MKEAPAFWYDHPGLRVSLLAPFGLLLASIAMARRAWTKKPYIAPIPVICIGNIVVGGAGKTPTALALARLLQKEGKKVAFVSRGYGGREKGPLLVDLTKHKAEDVGDEALLLAKTAPTWIARKRAAALKEAAKTADILIMDDGFQNPTVQPTVNLLVFDGAVGMGNGALMPAGPLRETLKSGMDRATACLLIGKDHRDLEPHLTKHVFKAALKLHVPETFAKDRPCLAFAGIARPEKFFASCEEEGLTLAVKQPFPDHHLFTLTELRQLVATAKPKDLQMVTTEKDYVRLPEKFRPRATALPVELMLEDKEGLLNLIQSSIEAARVPS